MALLNPITITITRSDNETKSFSGRPSNSEPFGITSLVGFEFPQVEVFTAAKGLGDGVFFTGQRLDGRTVEIHLKQNERYPQDHFDGWNNLKSFFNPMMAFTLEVDNDTSGSTVTRYLNDCRILAAEYQFVNASEPNPELIVQMQSSEPCFTASVSEALTFTDNVDQTFTYSGDAETFVQVELTVVSGSGGQEAEVTVNGALWTVASWYYISPGDKILLNPEDGTLTRNGQLIGLAQAPDSDANAIFLNWRTALGTNANTIKIHPLNTYTLTAKLVYNARYLGI